MKVLNLLASGGIGGIENLCKDIGNNAQFLNGFCFLFSEGTIYEEMKRQNQIVYSLVDCGNRKLTLSRLKKLIRLAKDYEIISLHHNALVIQVYFVLLKVIFPHKKYVFFGHSCFEAKYYYNYNSKVKNILRKYLLNYILKISDGLIFVSQAGKRSYEQNFNIYKKKKFVIYNGVDNTSLLDKMGNKVRKIQDRSYRIVYIGRLSERKGVHLLIEGGAYLLEKGRDIELWIVGEGIERKKLEILAKQYGMEQKVHFEGARRNIEDYLCNAHVFVYPSIWEEVFGISLVEAMAYGIPCVANQVGGIPEIICNHYNGILSNKKDSRSLADAIEAVLCMYDCGDINTMKQNCRETAKKFDISITVKNLLTCYQQLN